MARVADHLSVEDLEARLRSAQDPTATRHFQVIWLLARGHTIADVAAVTSFDRGVSPRNQLIERVQRETAQQRQRELAQGHRNGTHGQLCSLFVLTNQKARNRTPANPSPAMAQTCKHMGEGLSGTRAMTEGQLNERRTGFCYRLSSATSHTPAFCRATRNAASRGSRSREAITSVA